MHKRRKIVIAFCLNLVKKNVVVEGNNRNVVLVVVERKRKSEKERNRELES